MDSFDEYEPIGHYMLLVPKQAKEVTEAGIYIPEQARQALTQGTVVKVGSLVQEFKLGDEVIYVQHTEQTITIDKRPYILLEDSAVVLTKRIQSNPENPINKLMQATGCDFSACAHAFRVCNGQYEEALTLMRG